MSLLKTYGVSTSSQGGSVAEWSWALLDGEKINENPCPGFAPPPFPGKLLRINQESILNIFLQVPGEGEQYINVVKVLVHPNYSTKTQDSDFSILQVNSNN